MKVKRVPSSGLKILEELYKKSPKNDWLKQSLINGYIKLGRHDNAINMIRQQPVVKNLRHQAWLAHKENNIDQEREVWQKILEKNYIAQVHAKIHTFVKRSKQEIKLTETDIPLFCVERNEMLRLPFFLQYYRKLGVTQFIFVDNNSDDGSFEFLLEQPDCHVFWTNDSYQEAGFGAVWWQHLINQYVLKDQWFLVHDADEFLVYPCCENNKLDKLIGFLNKNNFEALSSFCCDMFPKGLKEQLAITHKDNFFEKSPYFYNNFQYYSQVACPYYEVFGGIRYKLGGYALSYLTMVTLIKKKQDTFFLSSRHSISPVKIANISGASLHFKFLGDFKKTALMEAARKQHVVNVYTGYTKFYDTIIDENFDFTNLDKTTKYQNSKQLVDLGLIKTTDEWERFCEK